MFYKKKTQPSVPGELSAAFTLDQKCAIIGTLMLLSQVDGDIDPRELQVIENTTKILGVNLDNTLSARLKVLKAGGMKKMFALQTPLSKSYKDWFIITVHFLISADGSIVEEEILCLGDLLKEINLTFDDYAEIVEKARAFMD